MKKLILILLLLLPAIGYAAKDTQTWNYTQRSRVVLADSTFIRGDTLFLNLLDLVLGNRGEFGRIDVDTLTGVDQFGDTCDNGKYAFAIGTDCKAYLDFEADSQAVAREEAIDDSLQAHWAAFIAGSSGDIESVALGNGGTGDATSGAVTLNVVAGTSTGLAVNADSVYAGTIPISHGGTGAAISVTQYGLPYFATTTTTGSTGAGTTTTVLHGNDGGSPAWGAVTTSDIQNQTITKNDIDSTASDFVFDDAYHVTSAVADSEYATLGYVKARHKFQLVELVTVTNPRGARSGNDTLMLPDNIPDTVDFMWRVVGAAADAKGVCDLVGGLPWGITQLDTVCLNYLTSSATAATSAIDSIQIWVTTGFGQIAPTWQASYVTALKSTGRAQFLWGLNDGDFNGGEDVKIKFFTNVDAAAWAGVLSCKLRCSE